MCPTQAGKASEVTVGDHELASVLDRQRCVVGVGDELPVVATVRHNRAKIAQCSGPGRRGTQLESACSSSMKDNAVPTGVAFTNTRGFVTIRTNPLAASSDNPNGSSDCASAVSHAAYA